MPQSTSLFYRALLALALIVGFYVLALGICAGLLYIPYAEWVYLGRIHFRLAVPCIGGAAIVLWSILPRFDRFKPPGPLLRAEEQPRLFEKLVEVARATQQEMPSEVYLVCDVNAWVSERGGMMGIGSRRVMGLGLPLMQILSVSELQAVLVHEFGHYYGGDTRLSPWIYKTRAAIERTVRNLAERESSLQAPFLWYNLMFLTVTLGVSRQQEYSADALAARIVGAAPLISALKKVRGAGRAFDPFFSNEFVPALSAGYRPPLAEGFQRFIAVPSISQSMADSVAQDLEHEEVHPLGSHPPLRDRSAALARLGGNGRPSDDRPAVALLESLDALEAEVIAIATGRPDLRKLPPIAWEAIGAEVYLALWRVLCRKRGPKLRGLTPAALPTTLRDLAAFGIKLLDPGQLPLPEERDQRALNTLGAALGVILDRHGWSLSALPGEQITFRKGDVEFQPFHAVHRLAAGKLSDEEFLQECARAGLSEVDLGESAEPSA